MREGLAAAIPWPRLYWRRPLQFIVKAAGRFLLRWHPDGALAIRFPDGEQVLFGTAGTEPVPLLVINRFRVISRGLRRGSIGFAESFIDGDVECQDLVGLFRFFLANRKALRGTAFGQFRVRARDRRAHRGRANTLRGSARNISDHYDLGNDFYRLWLDEKLVYSSALYTTGNESLEDAQAAKFEALMQALDLHPGMDLLEIGCGWGALAVHACMQHDAHVLGITLSAEQLGAANERARRHGAGTCRFGLTDYRHVEGSYDRILSVEMIEAVGEEHWPHYFRVLHDRLKPGGHAVIQAITIDAANFGRYRHRPDFIQRHVFPGGMLPTRAIIADRARSAGLEATSIRTFGESYALTLREWRRRFEAAWPDIARLGFDERFQRKWQFYLCYCEAGFLDGAIDVGIYRFTRPGA